MFDRVSVLVVTSSLVCPAGEIRSSGRTGSAWGAASVVVRDFDLHRSLFGPAKANTPLVVDADTVLTLPISVQSLEAMGWWKQEIRKSSCRDHSLKSHTGSTQDVRRQTANRLPVEDALGILVLELLHSTFAFEIASRQG